MNREDGLSSKLNSSETQKQEEIISVLDKAIEEKEKKYLKLKSEFLTLENENIELHKRLKDYEKRSNELSFMLVKYYEDVLGGSIELRANEQDDYVLDIKGFKKKPV